MILASKKVTGYSLGAPLWWLNNSHQTATGCIQGLSITAKGAMQPIYLTKYSRDKNTLSLAFSLADETLCALETTIGTAPQTYPLVGVSPLFVSGWVTLYPTNELKDINLLGTFVCPRYVHFIPEVVDLNRDAIKLHVYPHLPVDLKELGFGDSSFVSVSIVGDVVEYTAEYTELQSLSMDQRHIYSINGATPDSTGNITINLTQNSNRKWVLESNGICLKVGLNSSIYSCDSSNYIEAALNPNTYSGVDWPLELAFSLDASNRYYLNMDNVYQKTFNLYDNGGLAWNQLSAMHDGAQADAD